MYKTYYKQTKIQSSLLHPPEYDLQQAVEQSKDNGGYKIAGENEYEHTWRGYG